MSEKDEEQDDGKREDGSRNITPPLDIRPTPSKVEQETDHNDGRLQRANSQLAMSLVKTESQNYLNALSKSLPPSSWLANLPLPLNSPDSEPHENEDAMEYSETATPTNSLQDEAISRENCADGEVPILEDKTLAQQPSENDTLPLPQQVVETEENATEELVFTENYSSASLISEYLMIVQRKSDPKLIPVTVDLADSQHVQDQVHTKSDDIQTTGQPLTDGNSATVIIAEVDTPLFTMDEYPQDGDDDNEDDSPTLSSTRFPLNFNKDQLTVKPTPSHSPETISSNASSEIKDEVKIPLIKLDQADQHREPLTSELEAASGSNTVSKTGEVIHSIKRSKVCNSIARCSPYQTELNVPKFNAGNNVKVECKLYPQGLDQDCKGRNLTLTGTFHLPKGTKKSSLFEKQCTFKLSVYIYEGEVKDSRLIGQSSASHQLSDDERQSHTMCIAVHEVASQMDIIFSKRYPDKLFIKITTEMKFID